MKKIPLVGLLLASSQMAMAANWVEYFSQEQEDGIKALIDIDSMKVGHFDDNKQEKYVTVWQQAMYPTGTVFDGKYVDAVTSFVYYDCIKQKYNIADLVYYINGSVVYRANQMVDTRSSQSWNGVVPDSLADVEINFVCNASKQQGLISKWH